MSNKLRFFTVLVAAVVVCSVTLSLGFWQLRRAALKQELQRQMDQRQSAPALTNHDMSNAISLADWHHRPVTLQGRWLNGSTIFLDNRQMNARPGFFVVTPLRLEGNGRLLLVQRGWTPRDFIDRTRVPDVPTPEGVVTVSGRLAAAPSRVYELGDAGLGRIRQNLSPQELAKEWSADVMDASVVQTSPIPEAPEDGLLRQWPQVTSDVSKHHGYAFQWFGLSALIVCLYAWFQIISPRRHRASNPI